MSVPCPACENDTLVSIPSCVFCGYLFGEAISPFTRRECNFVSVEDTLIRRWERSINYGHFSAFHNALQTSHFVQYLQLDTFEAQDYFFTNHGLLFQNRYSEELRFVLTEICSSDILLGIWRVFSQALPRDLARISYSYHSPYFQKHWLYENSRISSLA
jgi:hypothetical protein